MAADGWMDFQGKKVFLKLKSGQVFQGNITLVENVGNGLVFLHLIDKFGKRVIFTSGELLSIKEEAY